MKRLLDKSAVAAVTDVNGEAVDYTKTTVLNVVLEDTLRLTPTVSGFLVFSVAPQENVTDDFCYVMADLTVGGATVGF